MVYRKVTSLDDLWQGEMRAFVVDGQRVLLVHGERGVHAFEDRCRHLGVALSAGTFDGAVITCSAHAWQYDGCTGRGVNPENVALRPFPVTVLEGDVLVDVAQSAPSAPEGRR